ncbi:MAG: sigma-54-dependent transcriptional regulator [Kiritimatiellia bacterium]
MPKLLIVDDERGPREALRQTFKPEYDVRVAASGAEAFELLQHEVIDLALLDVRMPDQSGLDLLRKIRPVWPELPVIMVTAIKDVATVVEAMNLGAVDFVVKPYDVVELRHIVMRALKNDRRERKVQVLETELARAFPTQAIVGRNPAFVAALDQIRQAAATDATVLIQGETGTGKELAARLLHAHSSRREEPFVAVHCAALPEHLMESELFGHEKGAFTGADRQKPGRFDLAGAGTIFFDEIGEMSLATQVKLLRVIQEREFMRVGGTRLIRTNVRIVSATARDLRQEAAAGRFREDLFYRMSVVPVRLPPLRERPDDIPLLIAHFLSELGPAVHAITHGFNADAMHRFCAYRWPGNVRELHNVIERVLVLHGREPDIGVALLPEEFHAPAPPSVATPLAASPSKPVGPSTPSATPATTTAPISLRKAVAVYERQLIEEALRQAEGVQTRAAARLGTTRRILRYKMAKLDIADIADDAPQPVAKLFCHGP